MFTHYTSQRAAIVLLHAGDVLFVVLCVSNFVCLQHYAKMAANYRHEMFRVEWAKVLESYH